MTRVALLFVGGILLLWCTVLSIAQPPGKGPPRKGPPGKENGKGGMNQQPAHPEDKAAFGTEPENPEPATPSELTHLAGRWYVRKDNPKVHLFRDANRFIEPFGHTGDSNKDGPGPVEREVKSPVDGR